MTATTSSAASETDSARNRTWGSSAAQRTSTSAPPPPSPPGRCTSSSTTVGRSSCTTATAESTESASPTTRTRSSRLARTPARNMSWSSTSTTSTGSSASPISQPLLAPQGRRQVDLGPAPGRGRHLGGAAAPAHPTQDRLSHPEAVVRDPVEVEALAPVAHEHLDPVVARLEVDRHGRTTVPRRVEQRLAGREQQGRGVLVGDAVPDHDRLDRDRLDVLDLRDDRSKLRRERRPRLGTVVVEPRAQLALLRTGDPGDGLGVVRLLADERERLQDRVVQVRGDVGPLGLARTRCPLLGQLSRETQPPRPEHERDPEQHRDGGDRGIDRPRPRPTP